MEQLQHPLLPAPHVQDAGALAPARARARVFARVAKARCFEGAECKSLTSATHLLHILSRAQLEPARSQVALPLLPELLARTRAR